MKKTFGWFKSAIAAAAVALGLSAQAAYTAEYDITNGKVAFEVADGGTYRLTGTKNVEAGATITVPADVKATVVLDSVSNTGKNAVIANIADGAVLTIELEGTSTLGAYSQYGAGLEKLGNGTLIIDDVDNDGTLNAKAQYGAAIGGGYYEGERDCNNIIIKGGTITADTNKSYGMGAGIGAGSGGSATNIQILGGTVTAISKDGAGVGGGAYGSAYGIVIRDCTLTASSAYGAAIGGGKADASTYAGGDCGDITIEKANVTATVTSGSSSAAIGSAKSGVLNGDILIKNSTVVATLTTSSGAAEIGCGSYNYSKVASGSITIDAKSKVTGTSGYSGYSANTQPDHVGKGGNWTGNFDVKVSIASGEYGSASTKFSIPNAYLAPDATLAYSEATGKAVVTSPIYVAKIGETKYLVLEEALAAVAADPENKALTWVDEDAWAADKEAYYDGAFYATLGAAIVAACEKNADDAAQIFIRPNHDGLTTESHDLLKTSITIFGNNAKVGKGWAPSIELNGEPESAASGCHTLKKNVSHAIYSLHDGAGFWGTRCSDYDVTLLMVNCQNANECYARWASGTGRTVMTVRNCTFLNNDKEGYLVEGGLSAGWPVAVYGNGAITVEGCSFEGNVAAVVGCLDASDANLTISITNTTFKNLKGQEGCKGGIRIAAEKAGSIALALDDCRFTDGSADPADVTIGDGKAEKSQATVTYSVKNTTCTMRVTEKGYSDTWDVSIAASATATTGTNVLPAVANLYKGGELVGGYSSIGKAVGAWNDAATGDYAIKLIAQGDEKDVTLPITAVRIVQNAEYVGKKLTIEPDDGVTATFKVLNENLNDNEAYGFVLATSNTNEPDVDSTITFKNVKFDLSGTNDTDEVVYIAVKNAPFANEERYAANLTFDTCAFQGNSQKVAVGLSSGAQRNVYTVKFLDCTGDKLKLLAGALCSKSAKTTDPGLTIRGCTVTDSISLANVAVESVTLVEDTTATCGGGTYIVRANGASKANFENLGWGTLTINGCTFTMTGYEEGETHPAAFVVRNNYGALSIDDTTVTKAEGIKDIYIKSGTWTYADTTYTTETWMDMPVAVAKIGDRKYYSLDKALAAVKSGETITMLRGGDYTVQNLGGSGYAIDATGVDGVVFNRTAGGWIAGCTDVTVKGVTWNVGVGDYQMFQGVTAVDCTFSGLLCTGVGSRFENCTFKQDKVQYCLWVYAGDITFDGCTFETCGKALNVYNEGNGPHKLLVKDCTFKNEHDIEKPAVLIKSLCGAVELEYDVDIENCKIVGNWPSEVNPYAKGQIQTCGLWDVEGTGTKIKVAVDGEVVWIGGGTPAARIGGMGYVTLSNAVEAVQNGETIVLAKDNAEVFAANVTTLFAINPTNWAFTASNITPKAGCELVKNLDGTYSHRMQVVLKDEVSKDVVETKTTPTDSSSVVTLTDNYLDRMDPKSGRKTLEIKLPGIGTITFDEEAYNRLWDNVDEIKEEMGATEESAEADTTLNFGLGKVEETTTKEIITEKGLQEVVQTIDVSAIAALLVKQEGSSSTASTNDEVFAAGKAAGTVTVEIPYKGIDPQVWYVDTTVTPWTTNPVETAYNADTETLSFKVEHFSEYPVTDAEVFAKVGDKKFATLQGAFDWVAANQTQGTTVTLTQTNTLTDAATLAKGAMATLDLNGKGIIGSVRALDGSILTIGGEGTIDAGNGVFADGEGSGKVCITNGIYQGTFPAEGATTNVFVSGGKFKPNSVPAANCAPGYEPNPTPDAAGFYTVKDSNVFIRDISAKQRLPWNGQMDIWVDVCWGNTEKAKLVVRAIDISGGGAVPLTMTKAKLIEEGVEGERPVDCTTGFIVEASEKKTLHLVWDSTEAVPLGTKMDKVRFSFTAN